MQDYGCYFPQSYQHLFDGLHHWACSIADMWPTMGRDMSTEGMVIGTITKPKLGQVSLRDYGYYFPPAYLPLFDGYRAVSPADSQTTFVQHWLTKVPDHYLTPSSCFSSFLECGASLLDPARFEQG